MSAFSYRVLGCLVCVIRLDRIKSGTNLFYEFIAPRITNAMEDYFCIQLKVERKSHAICIPG